MKGKVFIKISYLLLCIMTILFEFNLTGECNLKTDPRLLSVRDANIEFNELDLGKVASEKFLFFTDPHIYCYGVDDKLKNKMYDDIETVYYKSNLDFVISGGDWIDMDDTEIQAVDKLKLAKSEMDKRFDRHYMIVGNHDTNYQGEKRLTNEKINELWLQEYDKNYYSFKGNDTRFYSFDTGIDWKDYMVDYRREQIDWFANGLINNNDENVVIFMHIFTDNSIYKPTVFADHISKVAKAYNDKQIVEMNGIKYDFRKTIGNVRCIISGHVHKDYTGKYLGIPVVTTINTICYRKVSFDLCMLDYKNKKLHMIRYGVGDSRHIDI